MNKFFCQSLNCLNCHTLLAPGGSNADLTSGAGREFARVVTSASSAFVETAECRSTLNFPSSAQA
ncbi:MAG: hypothetical protein ACREVB_16790, partial [Burkholderiales bacterium]